MSSNELSTKEASHRWSELKIATLLLVFFLVIAYNSGVKLFSPVGGQDLSRSAPLSEVFGPAFT